MQRICFKGELSWNQKKFNFFRVHCPEIEKEWSFVASQELPKWSLGPQAFFLIVNFSKNITGSTNLCFVRTIYNKTLVQTLRGIQIHHSNLFLMACPSSIGESTSLRNETLLAFSDATCCRELLLAPMFSTHRRVFVFKLLFDGLIVTEGDGSSNSFLCI